MKSIHSMLFTLTLLSLTPTVFASNPTTQPSSAVGANTKLEQEQQVNDRKIVGILIAVDKGEIGAANIAKKKHISASILDYAKYLHQHHQDNLIQLDILAKSTGLRPLQSTTSESMAMQGKKDLKALKALNGVPFETAYIDAMVKGHTEGLQLIDTTLLKDVSNPKLKAFLVDFRTMVAHHLEMGLKLQSQLKNQH